MYIDMIRTPAPPIEGGIWLNGDPIRLDVPPGRPVLLDFWDYASIPSLGGIPYLTRWHDKYEKLGVAFVGVHLPSFPFGAEAANVEAAIRRLGLPYPVVVDTEGSIRKAFNIQSVPSRYVVDKDGALRFYQIGDDDYGNLELFLHQVLREMEPSVKLPDLLAPLREVDLVGGFTLPYTAEMRMWELPNETDPAGEEAGGDPATPREGAAVLTGPWRKAPHAQVLSGAGGVRIGYRAAEVYLIASHPTGTKLQLRLDEKLLGPDVRGTDVEADAQGGAVLSVGEPKPYQIVRQEQVERHCLEITAEADELALFSFQFASRMPRLAS